MSEVRDRYGRIADGFERRLRALTQNQWMLPTPCPDWTVRDLVEHVIATHYRVLARLDGGDPFTPDTDDLPGSWRQARARVIGVLTDESQAATPVAGMGGEQPFETLVRNLLCADLVVHTWDLARATGQDEQLDGDAVARAWEFMRPNDAMMRGPKGFGPKVTPEPGATAQTEFLNYCGRVV